MKIDREKLVRVLYDSYAQNFGKVQENDGGVKTWIDSPLSLEARRRWVFVANDLADYFEKEASKVTP